MYITLLHTMVRRLKEAEMKHDSSISLGLAAVLVLAWPSLAGAQATNVYNGAQRTSRLSSWGEPISRGFIIRYARQVRLF